MSSEQLWFVQRNGKVQGPFAARQLKQLANAGRITRETLVRLGETGEFIVAQQVKGLFSQSVPTSKAAGDVWPPRSPPSAPPIRDAESRPPVVQTNDPQAVVMQQTFQQVASQSSGSSNGLLIVVGLGLAGLVTLAGGVGVLGFLLLGRMGSHTEQVIARAEPAVALIRGRVSSGTGFIIQRNTLVTNRHVIENEFLDDLKVHFPSTKENGQFAVQLLYEDPEFDLAFLSINTSLQPLSVAREHQFRRGEEVVVIGNPGATDELVLENAISRGVMSTHANIKGQEYYQLGISINSGNSGGPVLNSSGQVVGVVTLKATEKEGLGFCVPLHNLNDSMARLDGLSPKEIAVNQTQHRLQVIVRRVAATGNVYKLAMQGYTEEMEKAINSRKKADDGLKAIRGQVEGLLATVHQSIGDLKEEATTVSGDPNVPEATRQRFVDLWTNYLELKGYVENPRGTFISYRTKSSELADNHDRLSESLKLLLGINE